eukprot:504927-Amphidinium_carterae.1
MVLTSNLVEAVSEPVTHDGHLSDRMGKFTQRRDLLKPLFSSTAAPMVASAAWNMGCSVSIYLNHGTHVDSFQSPNSKA